MRDIKFRGKSIDSNKWVYGSLMIDKWDNSYVIYPINDKVEDLVGEPVDCDSIGQYTGITNKNGKEIYEGDIVKYVDNMCKVEFVACVKYDAPSFEFWDTDDMYCGIELCESIKGEDEIEVIGNIYDNPELLEAENVRE